MNDSIPNSREGHDTPSEESNSQPFPVIGIGASAGGLEALRLFFEHAPTNSNVAFVIVTHLSPDHESHLAEILQSSTTMPIQQVVETTPLAPNRVYVIPPNRNLTAIDTQLHLEALEEDRRARAPIDHFFRTLAAAHRSQAICVVLSGTGADGALGLGRVKEMGGLTIAQEPTEAEFDSMPLNALATNQVDLVLPVREMAKQILDYVQNRGVLPDIPNGEAVPQGTQECVQKIITQIRVQTGHDFSRYKFATILRRIQHRMQLLNLADLEDYLTILRTQQGEVQALFNDFLISVTNFYRDREAFDAFEREVIPQLFQGKGDRDQVRVWVVGCATGEEAYSLAMLLLEYADRLDNPPTIQVFASDLSESALRQAREGLYPETISADVSSQRLQRFFTKEQGGYRIRKAVREQVLFTPHNLLKDPPFSRLDLISCRNLLIYLQRDVQRELFELFHYALRPRGFLFLGSSEVLDDATLFSAVNRPRSIYQRQEVTAQERHLPLLPLTLPVYRHMPPVVAQPVIASPAQTEDEERYTKVHIQLLERYAPPSILVDKSYDIVHYSPGLSRYLFQPAGAPTNHVLQRVREEFRPELATLLFRAFERKEPSISRPIATQLEGEQRWVTIGVWPGYENELLDVVLVLFYERDEPGAMEPAAEAAHDATVLMLEEDLAALRRRLQTMAEEYETSQEEMRASNEELQSINEELRSTAEELETSKEELQSINEELITVNQENKNKVEELSQLTSDLQNLLAATDIATIFLDRELRITRFTPRAGELFNVLMSDRGRPLAHITHKLGYSSLIDDAATVLRTLIPLEREVSSEDGRGYLMRLRPYRTVDDRINGVVITFLDITERLQHEWEMEQVMESLDRRVTERTEQVRILASRLLMAEQQVQEQMAHVLHDDLQQVLYSARMHTKMLETEVDGAESSSASEIVAELDKVIAQAIDLTRRVISDLAPTVLDSSNFGEVLSILAARMKGMHGLKVEVRGEAIPPITNDKVRLVLYQIIRELLFNVVKHANVNEARVLIARTEDELRIKIEDEGQGFDVDSIVLSGNGVSSGFGLAHARERIRWLGGELQLESQPEQGTRVTIVVPLSEVTAHSDAESC